MGHILFVEDDKYFADVVHKALTDAGFTVTLATDGTSADEFLRRLKPDLVLLDLLLPKRGGFTVLERMKEDKDTKDIPVIVLSNLGTPEDIDRTKKLGADKHLVKAHTIPSQIVDEVKRCLGMETM